MGWNCRFERGVYNRDFIAESISRSLKWLADDGSQSFGSRSAGVTQVDLMVFARQVVSLGEDEFMQFLNGGCFVCIGTDMHDPDILVFK